MTPTPTDDRAPELRSQVRDCIGETIPLRRRWVNAIMAGPIAGILAENATLRRQVAEEQASDAESLAMYRRARDRAEAVTVERDALAGMAGEALVKVAGWWAMAQGMAGLDAQKSVALAAAEARAREAEARAERLMSALVQARSELHSIAISSTHREAWEIARTARDAVHAALSPTDPRRAESAGKGAS